MSASKLTTACLTPLRVKCGACTRTLDVESGKPVECPCGATYTLKTVLRHWMETGPGRRIS